MITMINKMERQFHRKGNIIMHKKKCVVVWGCSSDTNIIKADSISEARRILLRSVLEAVGMSSLKEVYDKDNYGPKPDRSVFHLNLRKGEAYVDDGYSPSGVSNHESIVWKIVKL